MLGLSLYNNQLITMFVPMLFTARRQHPQQLMDSFIPTVPAHLLLLLLPLPVERSSSLALRPAAAALAGNQSLAVVDVGWPTD
jgi:hypothetical protein